MNRIVLSLTTFASALLPLILDSLLKGAALLAAAALVTLALHKASAAIRHLVWQVAIVALLIVPLLSVALPRWHVLPNWTATPLAEYASSPAAERPAPVAPSPVIPEVRPTAPAKVAAALPPAEVSPPPLEAAPISPVVSAPARGWHDWVPLVWTAGFALLLLRLLAAHLLLRHTVRRCTVLSQTEPCHKSIAATLAACKSKIGLRRPVTLLVDDQRTIPVVWGLFRSRLLLPAEALEWGDEQLRSVLLHELAHIKRHDPLVQALTQIACALHWWNPLAWLAAWRLHVERERTCDDLVLASGVRPSTYAEHLLQVATRLSPARWTQGCGLAMARKSSLEGRLVAVLSDKQSRRGVTRILAALTLVLAAAVAIPLSMLRAENERWDPPHAALIGSNNFTTYCVHDGKTAAFVIAYRGNFGSASDHTSNSKTRTWYDDVTLTLKTKNGKREIAFYRNHTAPDKLILAGSDYDLAKGRVLLLSDDGGSARQLALNPPAIATRKAGETFAKRIATEAPVEDRSVPQKTARIVSSEEANRQLAELDLRLTKLRAELALRKQTYGPNHPKILQLQRQLEEARRVEAELAPLAAPDKPADNVKRQIAELDARLTQLRAKLAQRHQVLGPKHPTILALQRQIEEAMQAKTALSPIARAHVLPKRKHFFNDKYSAVGVMSGDEVNFVLVYEGFISTGMQDWVSGSGADQTWGFDGFVHLVDKEKTRIGGKGNVDKRKIAVKYTSGAPDTLFLDGKAYDLSRKARVTSMGAIDSPGRVFILRDKGEPLQTARTLPLRNKKDLVTLGDFAVRDRFLMETYEKSRQVQELDGWVLGWDVQRPIQHSDGQRVAMMRIFPDGRVLWLKNGRQLEELKVPVEELNELLRWLAEEQQVAEQEPARAEGDDARNPNRTAVINMWNQSTDFLVFMRNGKRHQLVEGSGVAAGAFDPIRKHLWEFANAAKPSPPAAVAHAPAESAKVNIFSDGAINLNGKRVTLDELTEEAAKHPGLRVMIRANPELPHAKLVKVIEALKASGVEDVSIGLARLSGGKILVANRTGEYDASPGRKLYLCRPKTLPQWFTVIWPATDEHPKHVLKVHPNTSEQNRGNWAVAWEPGADALWWVDDSDVGKVPLSDPEKAVVTRKERRGRIPADFGLPEPVAAEFRELGFAIGREPTE